MRSPEDQVTRNIKNPEEGFGLVNCHRYTAVSSMMSGATGVRPSKSGKTDNKIYNQLYLPRVQHVTDKTDKLVALLPMD